MGKFYNGVLGTMTGKVGGVVGRTWKGINTVAAYQPNVSNPRTNLQVAQRAKMAAITLFASQINTSIIKPLWDRFAKGMSGYNAFIQNNIPFVSDLGVIDLSKLEISKGKMIAPVTLQATYQADEWYIYWDTAIADSYSMPTDKAYILITSGDAKKVIISAGIVQRSAGQIVIPSDISPNDEGYIYLAFKRADGTIVSNTARFAM
jgi:hypothetical protein